MVFQFEHVSLDQGAGKWDVRPFRLRDLKASFGRWQAGLAQTGWNSLYWNNHDQPRIVSRWGDDGAVPGAVGDDARDGAALPPRHALRLPGRGARHAQHAVRLDRRLPRHRVAQPLRRRRGARRGSGAGARRAAGDGPRQRAHPGAVGRLTERRVHHRYALDRGEPRLPAGQRGGAGRRPRLGVHALPPPDRAAAHRAGGGARRLHDAAARRRHGVRVHPPVRRRPGRGRVAGAGQLLRRGGARRRRRVGRRRARAGQLPGRR